MNFKIKEVDTKADIFHIYKIFKDEKESIFLDSSKEESIFSKYSFIGLNPFLKFTSYKNKITVLDYKNGKE